MPFGEDPHRAPRRLRRARCGPPSPRSRPARRPPTRARTTGSPGCSPTSTPGPTRETVAPPIYLGGVQRRACALAGEVADGFVSHPDQLQPALPARGLPARPGRRCARAPGAISAGDGFELVIGTPVITGARRPRRAGRAGAPTPPAGLLVLDARLRPHPRALRLGRPRPAPARPDPPRPLGRPGGASSPTRCSTTLVPCGTFAELPGLLLERFGISGQGIVVSPPADAATTTRSPA